MRFPEASRLEAAELATLLDRLLGASGRSEEAACARLLSNVIVAEQQAAIFRRVTALLREAEAAGEATYFSAQQRDELQTLLRVLRLQLKLEENG
jgi:hypothetical protein